MANSFTVEVVVLSVIAISTLWRTIMSKAYIVSGDNGQSYSDNAEWTVVASLSKARAKEITKKLNELVKYQNDLSKTVYDAFELPYKASHPQPVMSERAWASVKKKLLGDDVRAKWKKLDKENNERVSKNHADEAQHYVSMKEWNAKFQLAKTEYEKQFSIPAHLQEVVGLDRHHETGRARFGHSYSFYETELVT